MIDFFGTSDAFEKNIEFEYGRNKERYQFLRWGGQGAFDEFKVVPPGTGIVHQVNIEHLARTVMARGGGQAYPRHPRRHRLPHHDGQRPRRAGWGGVGGIEAEAAMLGQPVSMLIPQVLGFKLTGEIPTGVTATDVVLTITEMLRKRGRRRQVRRVLRRRGHRRPAGQPRHHRQHEPEFGSTAAIFPIDDETIRYLTLTGRSAEQIALVEAYAKEQGSGSTRPPSRRSPTPWSSTCRRSSRRSPARSARRTASR